MCPDKGEGGFEGIGAAKFKEQCLALLDQLEMVVTKRGKPVARVLPYDSGEADLIGSAAQAESEGGRFRYRLG